LHSHWTEASHRAQRQCNRIRLQRLNPWNDGVGSRPCRMIDAIPGTCLGRTSRWTCRVRESALARLHCAQRRTGFRGWLAAIHPADVELAFTSWRGLLDSERAGEVAARLRRHEDQYRRFLFTRCADSRLRPHGPMVRHQYRHRRAGHLETRVILEPSSAR